MDYDVQSSYNKFQTIPTIPSNLITYMINNEDQLWKLLAYNDANAWRDDSAHPSLTKEQKGILVYDGLKEINSCRLFPNLGQDDSLLVESSFIRIGMPELIPTNYVRGNTLIGFEILTHYKVSTLSNYQSRDDTILQRILELFNGADVPGIGRLFFDAKASSKCKVYLVGQLPYRGKALIMCANTMG